MSQAVADNLQAQLHELTAGIHAQTRRSVAAAKLMMPPQPGSGATKLRRLGLGSLGPKPMRRELVEEPTTPRFTPLNLTFALDIAPSSIEAAGRGVWVRGHVATGQVGHCWVVG